MNQFRIVVSSISLLLLLYSGCDKGLEPHSSDYSQITGFAGVVNFRNWPPPDSVYEIRLVAFKHLPTDSATLFVEWILGNVLIYPPVGTPSFTRVDSTGRFIDSLHYSITLTDGKDVTSDNPAEYAYVALAWRYSGNILTDWRPAGIYTLQPGTFNPATLVVPLHRFPKDIDINCDFRNPPPRPWH